MERLFYFSRFILSMQRTGKPLSACPCGQCSCQEW